MVFVSGLCGGDGDFPGDGDVAGAVHSGAAAGGPVHAAFGMQGKGIAIGKFVGHAGDLDVPWGLADGAGGLK